MSVNVMAKLPEDVRMKAYRYMEQIGLANDEDRAIFFTLLAYAYTCGQLDGIDYTKNPESSSL